MSTLLETYKIIDHSSSALSTIAVAVAALSCEAARANLSAFDLTDSGDGSVAKDDVGVASDVKVLLNGSKLVTTSNKGDDRVDLNSFSKIPVVNGNVREAVKSLHSVIRVAANSEEKLGGKVLQLGFELGNLGESSLGRVRLNLGSVGVECLKGIFEKDRLTEDTLSNRVRSAVEAGLKKDYSKLVKEVDLILEIVWKIVAWEAVTAFFVLEGGEVLNEKSAGKGGEADGGNVKVEKKKKKKVLLGKGTGLIVELIKDRVTSKAEGLEKVVEDLLLFLDPKSPEFDALLKKVKEILESNQSRRIPKTPKGTRDFAKEQMAIRKKAFSIITKVFERHCATALDTPAFELKETLTGKYGEDSKLIYDLADQGGELCSLRYDLTVPFSRYMAMNGLTSFKRYHIDKVWRRDNPSKGRYREFYQCDFDIAGQYEKMGPDFEVVRILSEVLNELKIGDYEIKLNHRKLLDGVLEICGVPPTKFRTICSSIDKLDKQSFEQVKKEMVEEKGLSVETADKIGTFVKIRGPPLELLSKIMGGSEGSELLEHNASKEALDDLLVLFEALEKSRCIDKVVFDLSLARGLDYYTGVIFEAAFKGGVQVGSIGAGGRYDNLIGNFGTKPVPAVGMSGTKQVPAVGMSLGIERVLTIMEDKAQNQAVRASETQVLVAVLGDKLSLAAELVSELWDADIKAEYKVHKKVMKLIEYAIDSKIPWMIIVGEREVKEGILRLKKVETTKEDMISRSKLVEEVQQLLETTNEDMIPRSKLFEELQQRLKSTTNEVVIPRGKLVEEVQQRLKSTHEEVILRSKLIEELQQLLKSTNKEVIARSELVEELQQLLIKP
ncbi:Anticodon-binding protein [Corchorus capsularis]|uniref:Histidine--tRNA ligase, cytoplasmic n=1 Tax=Corchorus capsularis TaxID=210143 RepID=A0A1R3I5Y4_COCAP|nr:Anticodon-binding protein [Corchorus capsularis]